MVLLAVLSYIADVFSVLSDVILLLTVLMYIVDLSVEQYCANTACYHCECRRPG